MASGDRLLLVDDDPSNRVTLGALLEDEGYRVHEAHDCAGALELLHATTFDVVILDWNLGSESAAGLLTPVRETSAHARLVILTGAAEELASANLDADAIVRKGEPFETLLTHVRESAPRTTPPEE